MRKILYLWLSTVAVIACCFGGKVAYSAYNIPVSMAGAVGGTSNASTISLTGNGSITGFLPVTNIAVGSAGQFPVTNAGATANAMVSMSGDCTLTSTGAITCAKVNSTSVPAGGSLTTGNAAYVSGSAATTYSALNLGGGAGWITGTLPLANLTGGTAAQFLVENAGATAPAWVSLSSNVTCTAAGACTVNGISGSSPIVVSAALTELGTNPAVSGALGLPNGATHAINFRNAANNGDILGIGMDSSNEITLGDGNTVKFIMSAGSNQLRFDSSSNIDVLVGNADPGFGSGAGVIAVKNSTTIPTGVPTAGYILSSDTVGVHVDTSGTSFNDYIIAPVQQGTANTQANKSRLYSGVARTTTNSAVTVLTIPVATSTTSAMIDVDCIGRDQASGTVGDFFAYKDIAAFTNVAGTVTGGNTVGTAITNFKTSMATATITFTISGTNVLVQATGLSSVTVDWTCEARAITN